MSLEELENIFFWYCITIGLIGNTLTCILIKLKISRFQHYFKKKKLNVRKGESCTATTTSTVTSASTTGGSNSVRTSTIINKNGNKPNGQTFSILINKNLLFDYRHNWNLYLYFIGINIFDTIILVNWILSRIKIKNNVKLDYYIETNSTIDNESFTLVNQNFEFKHFLSNRYISKNVTDVCHFNDSLANLTCDYNMSSRITLHTMINWPVVEPEIKLIALQGVCQIYYYLTIVSLQASFAYTLACLLDRLFKFNVIKKDITNNFAKPQLNQSLIEVNISSNASTSETTGLLSIDHSATLNEAERFKSLRKSFTELLRKKSSASGTTTVEENRRLTYDQMTVIHNQLRPWTRSDHSELVKQFFGKTSAYLIVTVILTFYFHLLWLYGTQESDSVDKIGTYDFTVTNRSNANPTPISIITSSRTYECKLFINTNPLPLLVMSMDLIILLVVELIKIVSLVLLAVKFYKSERIEKLIDAADNRNKTSARDRNKEESSSASMGSEKSSLTKTGANQNYARKIQDRYLLIKLIIAFAVLSVIFEIPSLLGRNLQFIFILITYVKMSNYQETASNDTTSGEYSFNVSSNVTTELTPLPDHYRYNHIAEQISIYTDRFDYLLLVVSSHKCILFMLFSYLFNCSWDFLFNASSNNVAKAESDQAADDDDYDNVKV